MWKTLAVAGVSLALTMPIALAQDASPNMSVAPPAAAGKDPAGRQYPGVISCLLCTTCGSYWPYTAGYHYTANVNYGGTYTRSASCAVPWAWRTGYTRLCCSLDAY
jgi:hypothetical protein